MEPLEAIKNNVFGTLNVAKAADKHKVKKFILISTDKAVNPPNIMGASKRVAELCLQMMDASSETEYAAVRFGNVLGSNGSVVPFFKKSDRQWRSGYRNRSGNQALFHDYTGGRSVGASSRCHGKGRRDIRAGYG
jgi:hypothetical protein